MIKKAIVVITLSLLSTFTFGLIYVKTTVFSKYIKFTEGFEILSSSITPILKNVQDTINILSAIFLIIILAQVYLLYLLLKNK